MQLTASGGEKYKNSAYVQSHSQSKPLDISRSSINFLLWIGSSDIGAVHAGKICQKNHL